MMPQNIMDYVKIYKNFISKELCKEVVEKLKKSEWQTHFYYDASTDTSHSYETDLDVCYGEFDAADEIHNKVWFALEQFILKDFKFPWFGSWNGYSRVRFNKYDVKTEMRLHCDHIHSMFDGERKGIPTLTVLGALNDDYEGGELMMFCDKKIHLPAGSVAVFPSNFMFPHQVMPVTKGVRYSYVSWAW